MPPIQVAYTQYMRAGVAGQIATEVPHTIITRSVQTAAGVAFGAVVVAGSADEAVDVPSTGGAYVGVTVLNPASTALTPPVTVNAYQQYENASVMIKGELWVTAGVNVTAEAAAGYDPTTGALELASTGSAVAIPNGRWVTTASAGSLAKLQLR